MPCLGHPHKKLFILSLLIILATFIINSCSLLRWLKGVPPVPPFVSVEVIPSAKSVSLKSDAEIQVFEPDSDTIMRRLKSKRSHSISVKSSKLTVSGESLSEKIIRFEAPGTPFIYCNGKKYRGQIEIKTRSSRLQVINVLSIEQYLYGVVPREMPSGWSLEALKAQAVAARTYAIYQLLHKKYGGYDLKSTFESQVYGGASAETTKTNLAVDETRDLVMAFKNELVAAYFHSTCGGKTEDDKYLWGGVDLPYLKARKDSYCKASPYFNWESEMDRGDFRKSLEKHGYDIGKIYWIKTKKTKTKRVKYVRIKGFKGKIKIKDYEFRKIWGIDRIKSRRYVTKNRLGGVVVEGHGWGHGVGMCQWGAKGMAEAGKNFKQILHHYYGGKISGRVKIKPYRKIKEIKVYMGRKN